jgi:hypothetical protein
MPSFVMPDVGALSAALNATPLEVPQSDKGRFFNYTWWPAHHREVEEPVLKAIARDGDPSFDRRVNVLRITERIDAKNGGQLAQLGFSPSEITTYVERAINKRLRQLTGGDGACYVIRNQKLSVLQLEHKAA